MGSNRAARMQAALTMRGLQSQASSSLSRVEIFTNNVMTVLSLLVKSTSHESLRADLLALATSAVALWDAAQTDERELVVYPTIDPKVCNGWSQDIAADDAKVIVLFPRMVARRYPWILEKRTEDPSAPGAIPEEAEERVEESCIHDGNGLGTWDPVVVDGEEEEEERKAGLEMAAFEEKKRALEESMKKLEPGRLHKRRLSQIRRDSIPVAGSGRSLSAVRMNGNWEMIEEGDD